MNDWLISVGEYLSQSSWHVFDALAKVTFCLLLALAGIVWLRRSSAAARHLVWQCAIVALFFFPILSMTLPRWNVVPNWRPPSPKASEFITTRNADADATHSLAASISDGESVVDFDPEVATDGEATDDQSTRADLDSSLPRSGPSSPTVSRAAVPSHVWLLGYLVVAWIVGAAVALAPVVIGHVSLNRLARQSRKVTRESVLRQVEAAQGELGIFWRVTVLESTRQTMPMTWGIFHSTVLLPDGASHWPKDRLRMVLLHELSHIKRRDCFWQWLGHIACVLYWFHPLVWVAAIRMRIERERACDDLVLNTGVRGSDYAEQLLDISTGCRRNVLAMCAGIAMARPSRLTDRLQAILSESTNRRSPAKRLIGLMSVLFALVVFPLAMLDWARADDRPGEAGLASTADEPAASTTSGLVADARDEPATLATLPGTWPAELPRYDTVDFSPDGTLLAAGSGFNREPGDLVVWDLATRRELFTAPDLFGIRAVKFSPDGALLATASFDRSVRLYDVAKRRQIGRLRGHTAGVDAVAFTPDGNMLATGARDKLIKLWDIAARKEIATLEGHAHRVSYLEFSSDGKLLASSSEDKTARLWNVATKETLRALEGHRYSVEKIRFAPGDEQVATVSWDRTVRLWDVATGQMNAILVGHPQSVLSAEFSADGTILWTGDVGGKVIAWDVQTQELLKSVEGHASRVYSIAVHPDGTKLATAGWDRQVKLWNAETLQQQLIMPRENKNELPKPVLALDYAPDGSTVATAAGDGTVSLRDAKSGRVQHQLKGHEDAVTVVRFSPNGKLLATGSYDFTIRLWNLETGEHRSTLKGENLIHDVRFSPDGKQLASGGYDRMVRLWDVASGRQTLKLAGHKAAVRGVAFSPDGKQLASTGSDKIVRIWDLKTGEPLHLLEGHASSVSSVEFAPDGQLLATAGEDKTIKLWEPASGKLARTLSGHRESVTRLAFSPQGSMLASGGEDNQIRLWNPKTGESQGIFRAHVDAVSGLKFAPDGSNLISGGLDGRYYLWKRKLTPIAPLGAFKTNHDALKCRVCLFTPDGQRIITAGDEKAIRIWDAKSQRPLQTLVVDRGTTCAALAPDGNTMATGAHADSVLLWDLDSGKQIAQAATGAGRTTAIDISSDGAWMVAGHANGMVTVCDARSGEKRWASDRQTLPVTSVAFSPDGSILATSTGDWQPWGEAGEVKLWNAKTGRELANLGPQTHSVRCVRFSPDARLLAAGGDDAKLKIWDVGTKQLLTTISTARRFTNFSFLPDGRSIVTGHFGGRVSRWDTKTGRLEAEYTSDAEKAAVFHVSYSPDGSRITASCSDGMVRIWPTRIN